MRLDQEVSEKQQKVSLNLYQLVQKIQLFKESSLEKRKSILELSPDHISKVQIQFNTTKNIAKLDDLFNEEPTPLDKAVEKTLSDEKSTFSIEVAYVDKSVLWWKS